MTTLNKVIEESLKEIDDLQLGYDSSPSGQTIDRVVKSYFKSTLLTQTRLSTIEEAKGCVPEKEDNSEVPLNGAERIRYHRAWGFNSARSQMLENLNKLK